MIDLAHQIYQIVKKLTFVGLDLQESQIEPPCEIHHSR
jgi:hypothetical protein